MTTRQCPTKYRFAFVLLAALTIVSTTAACDNFQRTNCLLVGDWMRKFEADTGETVPLSLYDPTWFVSSSDCWTTTIERANQCGAKCELFADNLSEIEYEYYLQNRGREDGGIVDGGN